MRDSAKLAGILPITATTLKSTKLGQFAVGFKPGGITSTPSGNIVVCGHCSREVTIFTKDGEKVLDLDVPSETLAWDVDSTNSNVFITDRATETILVFDHQGNLVSTDDINDLKGISGISISNGKVYISGEESNNIQERDLSTANKISKQKQFSTEIQLDGPRCISANGGFIAISCSKSNSVHCVDSKGRVKYTYGSPGQLIFPWGVTFDAQQNLFIADKLSMSVCVFSNEGHLQGQVDLAQHQLVDPHGIAIDNDGNLLVSCRDTNDMDKFYIVKFGYSLT